MARTFTAAERAAVTALRSGHHVRFRIQDADLVYRDYTQYLKTDWFTGAVIEESQDQSTMTLNATLLRQAGTLSLSPFRSDSLVNRNAGGSYATAIDAWRKWDLSVSIRPPGYPPTGSDWKEMCQGRIDIIEWAGDLITITGRGEEAVLLDFWIATERSYGSGGGVALETTIQSQIDDNLSAGVYTLSTPVSPSYLMQPWTQKKDRLFPSITAVSDLPGYVTRFRYDSSNVFRLTLFQPNRTATPGSEVWTVGADEITAYRKIAIDKQGIRNFIKGRFVHPTLGTQTVISPWQAGVGTVSCAAGVATFSSSQAAFIKTTGSKTEIIVAGISYTINTFNGTTGATLVSQLSTGGVPTFSATAFTLHDTISGSGNGSTTSIDRFGRNDLELDLSFATQVTDPTKAQAMMDAIRSDTEFPPCEQEIELLGAWFIQLHDYGRFLANGVHYDSDLYAAVTRIRHDITDGTIKTTLGVRGKPSSKYTGWRYIAGALNGAPLSSSITFAECVARITATTATQVTVTVTANPSSPAQQVQLVGVTGGASLSSGTAAGTWVTPNGSNNVWVFNRAAINGGVGQAQFRAGNTSAFPNDDDLVSIEEQGRDTVYLAARARVTATTATTLTVRVAVADPYPQGAASATIGYTELGLGGATSPATGQTVTPAATLTEAAGTFVDFTVTRPAFGVGAGRITFTVTAANRTSDSDAVDVPEVDRDTVALNTRARVTATTATTLTVRVAVADPFPQGAASVSIATQDLGVGSATTPASPQTVTPASTLTEAAGTFVDYTVTRPAFGAGAGRVTFTATNANRTSSSDAVDVPEIGRDTQSITVRVTRQSETADQIVVRVEGITPNAAATATVNYDAGGLTISPSTGGTFSATTSFGTTGHIDYTITRDTQGGTPRRVAFTITAAGSIDGTDGVDVPPNGTRFRCKVRTNGAGTSVSANTPTAINWATEDYDTGGLHDNSTNNTRFTVPTGGNTGLWRLMADVDFPTQTGKCLLQIRKNGSTILGEVQTRNSGHLWILHCTADDDAPSVGDYYEAVVTHDFAAGPFFIGNNNGVFAVSHHP